MRDRNPSARRSDLGARSTASAPRLRCWRSIPDGPAIWAGCLKRVGMWRVPPHWSTHDWLEEMHAQGAAAACQAIGDYDPKRGVPQAAFVPPAGALQPEDTVPPRVVLRPALHPRSGRRWRRGAAPNPGSCRRGAAALIGPPSRSRPLAAPAPLLGRMHRKRPRRRTGDRPVDGQQAQAINSSRPPPHDRRLFRRWIRELRRRMARSRVSLLRPDG